MRIVVCEDEPFYQTAIAEAIERWQSASGHTDVELSVFWVPIDVRIGIHNRQDFGLFEYMEKRSKFFEKVCVYSQARRLNI